MKFFAEFIELDNVLREKDKGNRATEETMSYLRKIHKKIDGWIQQEREPVCIDLSLEENAVEDR